MDNTITNSWSFVNFVKKFPHIKYGEFKNSKGEVFHSLIGVGDTPKDLTFINFSKSLGELSVEEIRVKKDELQVVEHVDNQGVIHHTLCKTSPSSWTEVEF